MSTNSHLKKDAIIRICPFESGRKTASSKDMAVYGNISEVNVIYRGVSYIDEKNLIDFWLKGELK